MGQTNLLHPLPHKQKLPKSCIAVAGTALHGSWNEGCRAPRNFSLLIDYLSFCVFLFLAEEVSLTSCVRHQFKYFHGQQAKTWPFKEFPQIQQLSAI